MLIAPRLVLTAATCVCASAEPHAPAPEAGSAHDAAICAPTAAVTVVAYEPPANGEDSKSQNWEHKGSVRPLVTRDAELAVVLLDRPVKGVVPSTLAETEAEVGEPIVIVGYPRDTPDRGIHRKRHFNRSKLQKAATSGDPPRLVTHPSPRADAGLRGGPCLRETGEGTVLVGILSGEAGEDSVLTSTYSHRDWLLEEIQRAAQAGEPEHGKPGR